MSQVCPLQNDGSCRGPPIPLVVIPIVYQIVRSTSDLKLAKHIKDLVKKGGPRGVAENAHYIMQYALSRVPSNLIYWFASKVLNLPSEVAVQTTEFLRSRTQLESLPEKSPVDTVDCLPESSLVAPSDVDRRLEKLEVQYQMLQQQHMEALKLLDYKSEIISVLGDIAPRTPLETSQSHAQVSTELVKAEASSGGNLRAATRDMETQTLVQEIGLRLGKAMLSWLADMMGRTVLAVGNAKPSSELRHVAMGRDLTRRLSSANIT
ncbi:hypothetical protein VPNG_04288 [Cytospora leucostoma]|uniref:Uncharacterized protein n=1 Tax=Cytospora leucostoma TaxID=1230097 RepID=A0A423XDI7_9PEZI|nr:hypothetical protein VPNG_04288 [Cytospora leucostoma]